jgi:hypothetical protein
MARVVFFVTLEVRAANRKLFASQLPNTRILSLMLKNQQLVRFDFFLSNDYSHD